MDYTKVFEGKMVTEYSGKIIWNHFDGSESTYGVSGCETKQEVIEELMKYAILENWYCPKWYEFWRWNDIYPEELKVFKDKYYGKNA